MEGELRAASVEWSVDSNSLGYVVFIDGNSLQAGLRCVVSGPNRMQFL